LAGAGAGRFDVPDDRMPPLGYWAGWGWSKIFGLSEASLRTFGIVIIAVAAAFLVKAARNACGVAAGYVAGLSLVLSPQMIMTGVEIRAYPLFALWSAMACAFLLSFLATPEGHSRKVSFFCMVAACVAAMYTHFFGLMLSGGIFIVLAYLESFRRRKNRFPVMFVSCIALASLGLIPFARAAFRMSPPSDPEKHRIGREFIRLLYRLLGGHPVTMVYPIVAACVFVGLLLLFSAALSRRPEEGRLTPSRSLFIVLGSGLAAAVLLFWATRGFNSLQISYNVWMLPPLSLAAACALGSERGLRNRAAMLGATLLVLGQSAATIILLANAPIFAHSSADRLAGLIRDPSDVTILLDEKSTWAHAYFPLTYRFGRGLRQCLVGRTPDGQLSLHLLPHGEPIGPVDGIRSKTIAFVSGKSLETSELAVCVRNSSCHLIPESPVVAVLESGGWRAERSLELPAFGGLRVTWLSRTVSP
jgi:hypothetical protein